jgi:hypothetical protein
MLIEDNGAGAGRTFVESEDIRHDGGREKKKR